MNESPRRRLSDRRSGPATLISARCTISGHISGEGEFVVNGTVEGDCEIAGTLTLSEHSRWIGTIQADNVIIAGNLEGDIEATGKVEITSTARISGSVVSEAIAVAAGAVVEGVMKTTGSANPLEFTEKRSAE